MRRSELLTKYLEPLRLELAGRQPCCQAVLLQTLRVARKMASDARARGESLETVEVELNELIEQLQQPAAVH